MHLSDFMSGTLYLVATPIGNLEDMTFRAVRILSEVDTIYAEDTRHSKQLLSHFKIQKPLKSYHDFNQSHRENELVTKLESGLSVALISDAGTPGISDPGFRAVRACVEKGLPVVGIPGPCAAILALSISGLPTDEFHFVGFLPQKVTASEKRLLEFKTIPGTIVFYESPYRIVRTLSLIEKNFPDRKIVVARELTKKFEEIKRGVPADLVKHFESHAPKGEFVIMIEGEGRRSRSRDAEEDSDSSADPEAEP